MQQKAFEIYLKEYPETCEEWVRDLKLKDDPRVMKIGKFYARPASMNYHSVECSYGRYEFRRGSSHRAGGG